MTDTVFMKRKPDSVAFLPSTELECLSSDTQGGEHQAGAAETGQSNKRLGQWKGQMKAAGTAYVHTCVDTCVHACMCVNLEVAW